MGALSRIFGRKKSTFDGPNPDIGNDPVSAYRWTPLYGRFSNGFAVPDAYTVPAIPINAGGNHYTRQLNLFAPQIVAPQLVTNVGIAGDGSSLTGQLTSLPLIDVNNAAPGN